MPIPQINIRIAKGTVFEATANDKFTARASRLKTAFLCHSHKDRDLALALQDFLWKHGWKLYIDWQDASMPDRPNRETADKIQGKIRENDWLLFLATQNSMTSRWCPWEIGYGDSAKGKEKVVIIPTSDASGSYGSEYLELYRRIDLSSDGRVVTFGAGLQYTSDPLTSL
jgi:hypothetical protein